MMNKDITLDQLPEHVLEEIFALTSKLANLRLVCKTFKRVIDNSSRLLKDEWLSVENTLTLNSGNIHYPYQNLVIHSLGAMELYWMSKYQHKDRIKSIRITSGERCPTILQYIINNFNSLEILDFDMDRFYDEKFFNPLNMRLIPNKQSKLKTLCIGYYQNKQSNILEIFADIPTIKNLYIHDFDILIFPRNVQWKLEKLLIPAICKNEYLLEIDNFSCKQFLSSQQATLKELRFHDTSDYTDYIMRTMPNLEYLTLSRSEEIYGINDEFMISNLQLKHLSLIDICDKELPILEILLRHYKNIKSLCLISNYMYEKQFVCKPIEAMNLSSITQMFLKSPICLIVLKANLPNLKVLGLQNMSGNDMYDVNEIPSQNFTNIVKLCFDGCEAKDILTIVQKCAELSHLNINYMDINTFFGFIINILAVSPRVKYLGIVGQKFKYEVLRNLIGDENIILKRYDDFTSIIAEDWGQEFADLFNFFK